jgi:hypothetical protein
MRCIWLTEGDDETEWESDWLQEICGPTWDHLEHVHDPHLALLPREEAILVFHMKSGERARQIVAYLSRYEQSNVPFGLVHLSDEFYSSDYRPYEFSMCRWVWRNYWHPALALPKVRVFALGFKKGFAAAPAEDAKAHPWCFAGNLKHRHPDRAHALRVFLPGLPQGRCVLEDGDSFSNRITGLDTPAYRDMLATSWFALSPPGNVNMDSFRIYEALEAGAIPVVTATTQQQSYAPSYWHRIFDGMGPLPFVVEDTWEHCLATVQRLLESHVELEGMQSRCCEFWQEYKKDLRTRWAADVATLKDG